MSDLSSGRLLLLVVGLLIQTNGSLVAAEPNQKPAPPPNDWKVFRGNASRSAQGVGGAALLEASWRLTTLPSIPGQTNTKDWIKDAVNSTVGYLEKDRQQSVLPSFFPIAAAGKLVYRAHDAIWGVNAKTGKVEWYQGMRGSLHNMVNDRGMRQLLDQQWKTTYLQSGPQGVYFENSLIGTLSTDGNLVFAIDDVALPPPPMWTQQFMWGGKPQYPQAFAEFFNSHNQMLAVELDSGKLKWELPPSKQVLKPKPHEFDDTYFLGPPLPLDGKLYVLTEKKRTELWLVCIDPSRTDENRSPQVLWTQTLGKVRDPFASDSLRRLNSVHLASADGVLVCPTNDGTIFGVDTKTHGIVWTHKYREASAAKKKPKEDEEEKAPPPAIDMNGWRHSAPIIQHGKVVFTAPDATTLECLELHKGNRLWKENRQKDELYLAGVYNGKVLIVGKRDCRALNLKDGKPAWKLESVGMPSGLGVASDNIYYLPLRSGGQSKQPEVCSIDINKGQIVAHMRSRKQLDGTMEVPGNLLFVEGQVISQTATEIVAYPQLRIKLDKTNERLLKDPKDPVGLTDRGTLLLDAGRLEQAAEDLRAALANQPPPDVRARARAKLFETLTELLQRDFNAAEKYLKEYEEVSKVEMPPDADPEEQRQAKTEQMRRRLDYLSLLARGREQQGRLVEALSAYAEFGEFAGSPKLVRLTTEPAVEARPDVWARGQTEALFKRAKPEQRKELDAWIAARWKQVENSKDAEEVRRFVAIFGSISPFGQKAKMRLAEMLLEKRGQAEQREAERYLLELRDHRETPEVAGRAIEALARLTMGRGLAEDAAFYYRQLGRDFAKTVIRDGKTGADFLNDIATDKRFIAYLEDAPLPWAGKLEARKVAGNFPMQPLFTFEPDGDVLPFFRRHRVALDLNYWQLRLIGRDTNEGYWKSPALVQAQHLYNNVAGVRHTYHTLGQLLILNLGHMLYCFDAAGREKLWEYNLYSAGSPNNAVQPQQRRFAQDKDGHLVIEFVDGWTLRLGGNVICLPTYVCLHTRNGLVSLDPTNGGVLWSRLDVSPRAHIFGDDQHIFVVETNADGAASSTKVLTARDGSLVRGVADFAPLYDRRVRLVGRNLLLKDGDSKAVVTLRLYDVLTGKDLWKQTFPAETVILRSEDPNLAGVAEPNGTVTVVDLRAKKIALKTAVKRQDVDKVQEAHLLPDNDRIYIAFNNQINPQMNPWGEPMSNLMYGMRSIPVNGMIYAFDRESGKATWWHKLENQMLLMDRFSELPILQFTSRYNRAINNQPNRFGVNQVVAFKSITKRTGKLLMDEELPDTNQFYALNVDAKAGRIELVSYNLKIVHTVVGDRAKKRK